MTQGRYWNLICVHALLHQILGLLRHLQFPANLLLALFQANTHISRIPGWNFKPRAPEPITHTSTPALSTRTKNWASIRERPSVLSHSDAEWSPKGLGGGGEERQLSNSALEATQGAFQNQRFRGAFAHLQRQSHAKPAVHLRHTSARPGGSRGAV